MTSKGNFEKACTRFTAAMRENHKMADKGKELMTWKERAIEAINQVPTEVNMAHLQVFYKEDNLNKKIDITFRIGPEEEE